MIAPGTVIGGYRIDRVLGTGGMGTVYAAADPHLPRQDALKVLSSHLSADPDFRARFLREAEVAAGLDHPNIVSIYNRGEAPQGQLWIAMQLVEGTDAEQALRAGTMSAHRAVHIVSEIAKALDYAHGRGVIHRDVKPANFLLSGEVGPEERVLLADFGIARALDDAAMTAAGSVVTTAAFAAPELLTGEPAQASSDLYALGASLYRLLSGQNPFPGETMSAQMMAHLRQPPPQLTAVAPWLPPAFDSVITTAMAKDRAARYQSGQALATAAQAALRTLKAAPDPSSAATQRAATLPGSHPGFGPVSAAGYPSAPQPVHPRTAYPPHNGAARGTRRTRTALISAGVVLVLLAGGITAVALTRTDHAPGTDSAAPSITSSPASSAATPPPQPTTTTTTTPPPAPVDDADLPALLLPPAELAALLGSNPSATPGASGIANDASTVTPTQCISALLPMQRLALDNTGFRAGYSQQFTPNGPTDPRASQGVVSFPSAEMAAAFITREEQLWRPCANQVLTMSANSGLPERSYQFTAPSNSGGVLAINANRLGAPLQCQHALTARSNIVVDVTSCLSPTIADQAEKIARAIAERIQ